MRSNGQTSRQASFCVFEFMVHQLSKTQLSKIQHLLTICQAIFHKMKYQNFTNEIISQMNYQATVQWMKISSTWWKSTDKHASCFKKTLENISNEHFMCRLNLQTQQTVDNHPFSNILMQSFATTRRVFDRFGEIR